VVVLAVLGIYPVTAFRAWSADAEASVFSADRAFEHIEAIAQRPRPIGSAGNAEARAHILAELGRLGIEARGHGFEVPDYFGSGEPVEVVNVVGRIPGTGSTRAVALMAHYDTVPPSPGANDNAASVATLLETARALVSGPPVRNDILLLFTDAEEPAPRYGAAALAGDDRLRNALGFVVNFEAVGGSGASLLVETSGPGRWVMERYARAVSRPAAFSVLTATTALMGDVGTDFDAFRNAGLPGLHFAYMHGSPNYHTAADDIGSVGRGSLQHHGDQALALAREFGDTDLNALPGAASSVYFTIGNVLVRYPAAWSLPLLVLAAAVSAWAARGRTGDWRALGWMVMAGAVALVAGTAVWMALAAVRTTPTVVESYAYLAGLGLLCVFLAARLLRGRGTAHAAVLLWLLLAIPTSIWLPGTSYLFLWPALAASLSLGWRGDRWRLARFTLVAAPTVLLSLPVIDVFFQMSLPRPGNPDSQLAPGVVLPLLLLLLAVGLLRSVWTASSPHGVRASGPGR
jgi:hypothetical protein